MVIKHLGNRKLHNLPTSPIFYKDKPGFGTKRNSKFGPKTECFLHSACAACHRHRARNNGDRIAERAKIRIDTAAGDEAGACIQD